MTGWLIEKGRGKEAGHSPILLGVGPDYFLLNIKGRRVYYIPFRPLII